MEKRNSNVASTNKAKTRKTISEDDYVAFYLSQNLVEDWDAEEFAGVLKNWYKTLRNAEALDTEEGKEFTDYVAEEVETALSLKSSTPTTYSLLTSQRSNW